MLSKEYCKSLAKNIELIDGVREVIVFSAQGMVLAHNIKAFAVKKAVMVFLFHHLTEVLARSANQLTPTWYVAHSTEIKLMIGQLVSDVYVAVTADLAVDEGRLFFYLQSCGEDQQGQG